MALLGIKNYPDEILRKKCAAIETFTDKERGILDDMLFTMRHFCGIGLAAPQVGIAKRLIVASVDNVTVKLANPEIVSADGSGTMPEGCLSVANALVDVERPAIVTVKGLSGDGHEINLKASGLLARVLQHEIDHLNGKLIIDYAI